MRKNYVSSATFSTDKIRKILLDKIEEEQEKIPIDANDIELNEQVISKKGKANVVSLFSGAGGLDLGLELSGIDVNVGKNYTNSILEDKEMFF